MRMAFGWRHNSRAPTPVKTLLLLVAWSATGLAAMPVAVTAAWVSGRTPFYSTSWANTAPLANTRKLGLIAYPHPSTARARRAYEKAGFEVTSEPVNTPWCRAILMECWPKRISRPES